MAHRQTRIFVPPNSPFDDPNWVETLVGSVIVPLVECSNIIERFWFSRYIALRNDSGDCDISLIPEDFGINNSYQAIGAQGLYRSLRFRYEIEDSSLLQFEDTAREAITKSGYAISDFRDFQSLHDLGGDRFIGGERTKRRREERAYLIYEFLHSICTIFIHCLIGPDESGKYQLEKSDNDQNPHESIFESVHHLLCNITDVPLLVQVPVSEGSKNRAFRVRF